MVQCRCLCLQPGLEGGSTLLKLFIFFGNLNLLLAMMLLSLYSPLSRLPPTHTHSLSLPLFLSLSPRPLSRYDNATAKDAVEKAIQAGIDHVCVNIYQ